MSTSYAVLELIEEISNDNDNKNMVLVYLLILKKNLTLWTMRYLLKLIIMVNME